MKLLAIDTSTEACSASLYTGNGTHTHFEVAPRRHAELILPMIHELLSGAELELNQLDALAFGRGPGAFTGVRIAAGIIQGLACAVDLPVIPVSSLATLAQSVASEHDYILPAFDARMQEIYYGFYSVDDCGLVQAACEEDVAIPDSLSNPSDRAFYGIGTGWDTYHEVLLQINQDRVTGYQGKAWPSAEHMIPLAVKQFQNGDTVPPEQALPVYIRNKVTG